MPINELIATGTVQSLCVNGSPVDALEFSLEGPRGDRHATSQRKLSGHDSTYITTSSYSKGDEVFNWRTWTGLSTEEVAELEDRLGLAIPQGCLLENITLSGIPNFSVLAPTTRLVFPWKSRMKKQAILAVWEQNGPCHGVGKRLEEYHQRKGLSAHFIATAQRMRGVMGFVLAEGHVEVGDSVLVYPPNEG